MKGNRIRTSAEMASVASHTLAGNIDEAYITMLADDLLAGVERARKKQLYIEEIAKSLAGSALSNRRK